MNRPSESRRQELRKKASQSRSRSSSAQARQPLKQDSEHVHAQWYVDSASPALSGVNPRVEEPTASSDHPAFISLPLALFESSSDAPPKSQQTKTPAAKPNSKPSIPQPKARKQSRMAQTHIDVRAPRAAREHRQDTGSGKVPGPTRSNSSNGRQVAPSNHATASHRGSQTSIGPAGNGRGSVPVATATDGEFAGRRFRLDHADWIPTPHNEAVKAWAQGESTSAKSQPTAPVQIVETKSSAPAPLPVAQQPVAPQPAIQQPAAQQPAVPARLASALQQLGADAASVAHHAPAATGSSHVSSESLSSNDVRSELPSTRTTVSDVIGPKSQQIEITSAPLRAAWEVDDFRWPKLSSELLLSQGSVFDQLLKAIRLRDSSARILAVTGMRPGDGRTTLSICLARWAAAQGHNTLLVDGDLLRGKLVEMSGLEFDLGWQSNATSGLSLGESLIRSTAAKLTLLPLNTDRIGAAQLPESAKQLDKLLSRLRSLYDWIVVDSGTAQEMARFHLDSAPMIDVAVVVRNLQATTPQELETAQRHLVGIGIRQLAIAENFGRRSKAG